MIGNNYTARKVSSVVTAPPFYCPFVFFCFVYFFRFFNYSVYICYSLVSPVIVRLRNVSYFRFPFFHPLSLLLGIASFTVSFLVAVVTMFQSSQSPHKSCKSRYFSVFLLFFICISFWFPSCFIYLVVYVCYVFRRVDFDQSQS